MNTYGCICSLPTDLLITYVTCSYSHGRAACTCATPKIYVHAPTHFTQV